MMKKKPERRRHRDRLRKTTGSEVVRKSKKQPQLSDDDQWNAWRQLLEQIHQEMLFAFEHRFVFREIMKMFQNNPVLQTEGGFVWEYLRGTYGRDQAMAVRREADHSSDVINLIQLMYQMTKRPKVMSRQRYKSHFPPDTVVPEGMQDEQFTELCGPGPHMDPKIIKRDRRRLERDCKKVVIYANKKIAHRSAQASELQLADVHRAMDAIEAVYQKYYVLLTGGALVTATPTIQFYWDKVFTIPWKPK